MRQINTFALFNLGDAIAELKRLTPTSEKIQVQGALIIASMALESFGSEIGGLLATSAEPINALKNAITSATAALAKGEPLGAIHPALINFNCKRVEMILSAELQTLDTYIVTQIAGYNMPLLVRNAEVNIPEDVVAAMPDDARKDFREAGRCLAFELPTACGYHTLRATEKVLRLYYEVFTAKKADRIDWKPCLDELKASNADQKTIQVLDQIRELHRNPVAHPDVFLSMKEAQGIFNIAISAITAVIEQVQKLRASKKQLAASSGSP
jgi:hypothetical protein